MAAIVHQRHEVATLAGLRQGNHTACEGSRRDACWCDGRAFRQSSSDLLGHEPNLGEVLCVKHASTVRVGSGVHARSADTVGLYADWPQAKHAGVASLSDRRLALAAGQANDSGADREL